LVHRFKPVNAMQRPITIESAKISQEIDLGGPTTTTRVESH